MNLIRQILKIILLFIIGGAIGLLISIVLIMLFTDTTVSEILGKMQRVDLLEGLAAAAVGIASLLVSVPLLVILHEGGHLVCGLMSGYRFISFRIFSFTFIRLHGHLSVRRFSIAGTGGQCLLCPPDRPVDEIPTGWYNMGGVLANIVALAAVIPLLLTDTHPFVKEFAVIFCLIDVFIIITNGIPMVVGGFGNDAYNALLLRRNLLSKLGLVNQLQANALIQEGVRPKDMPDSLFTVPEKIDYRNALEVSLPLLCFSRMIDEEQWEKAYVGFSELYAHKNEMIGIYVNETACELLFTALVTGRLDEARALLDNDQSKYIETYRKVMSSKERIRCAVCLYLDNDPDKAMEIYRHLEETKDDYLLQGEVKSDLAILDTLLSPYKA